MGSSEHLLCAEAKELVSSVPLCQQETPSGISKSTGTTALVGRMLLPPSTLFDCQVGSFSAVLTSAQQDGVVSLGCCGEDTHRCQKYLVTLFIACDPAARSCFSVQRSE